MICHILSLQLLPFLFRTLHSYFFLVDWWIILVSLILSHLTFNFHEVCAMREMPRIALSIVAAISSEDDLC